MSQGILLVRADATAAEKVLDAPNHSSDRRFHVSMIGRAADAEALVEEKERAQVTLNSIGDAVVSTDVWVNSPIVNANAEGLTGWSLRDAMGPRMKLSVVLSIIE